MLKKTNNQKGFTLVELLVVIAVAGILSAVIFTTYTINQGILETQTQVSDVQQNVRTAMLLITRDLRMAAYDPNDSWKKGLTWGFTKTGFRDLDGTENNAGVYSFVEFSGDIDESESLTAGDQIIYGIGDVDNDGSIDLTRNINDGNPAELLADNILSMGIAYAYDNDGDGNLDTYTDDDGDEQVIWAIDSDNDELLDQNLDRNDDGVIDEDDEDPSTPGVITGQAINPNIEIKRIRAVRIWLLGRSAKPDRNFFDTKTYVVGRQVITPNDNFRKRPLEAIVLCRNMGME